MYHYYDAKKKFCFLLFNVTYARARARVCVCVCVCVCAYPKQNVCSLVVLYCQQIRAENDGNLPSMRDCVHIRFMFC